VAKKGWESFSSVKQAVLQEGNEEEGTGAWTPGFAVFPSFAREVLVRGQAPRHGANAAGLSVMRSTKNQRAQRA
jgi:hypothetical protein